MSDQRPSTGDHPAAPSWPDDGRHAPGWSLGEAALHEPTAAVLDIISEGLIILDRDWRFTFVNPAAEQFVQRSRADLLGRSLWECFPEAANRRFGAEYRRAVAERVAVRFEEFYPEPLNAWYEVRAYPSSQGLAVFFRDVTERRTVEEALRERAKEMRCLYCVAALVGDDGPLEEILQGVADVLPAGWLHPDIAGARILLSGQEYTTANFRETAWRQAAEFHSGGGVAGLVEVCYLEERPARDEGPFLKEERDLIDAIAERLGKLVWRKRAAEALRASEEWRRRIIQTAMDGFWLVDVRGRLLEVNDAYCRMSGYSDRELLTMRIPDLEAVETPEETNAHIRTLIAQGEARFESRHRRKDGSVFDVEVSVQYWPVGVGQFVVFLRDISERRAAQLQLERARADTDQERQRLEAASRALAETETALHHANQELLAANDALQHNNRTLEARVEERTADLAKRSAQLQALALDLSRAEERERQRVARVIHDHLQQLLSVARINLGMALEQVKTRSIHQRLSELDDLIAESLDITRTLTAELSPAILHRSGLAAALRWLARWYGERFGLTVGVKTEGEVELDPEARATLFRAVRELLFNVVKHAQAAKALVQLRRTADGRARIVVSDDGVGFDPELLRARDGTMEGFGLFSIRERLDMLGGSVEVDSADGQGTSITIIGPPCRPPEPGVPAAPPVALKTAAARKRAATRRGKPGPRKPARRKTR